MNRIETLEYINTKTYNKNGTFNSNYFNEVFCYKKEDSKEFYNSVIELTSFIDHLNPTFYHRVCCITNDIYEIPLCYCGKQTRLTLKSKYPFSKHCSISCGRLDPTTIDSRVEKFKSSYVPKGGRKKSYEDFISGLSERYKNFTYNVHTYYEKGGCIEVTCNIHNYTFYPNLKDLRTLKTNCKYCRSENLSNNMTHDEKTFKEKLSLVHTNLTLISTYTKQHDTMLFKCDEHGEFYDKGYLLLSGKKCPKCNKGTSEEQKELTEYIKSITNEDPIISSRKILPSGREVDIAVNKVLIEYNGLYWHNDQKIDKRYHLDKTLQANDIGCRMYHVFSNEWKNETKRKIWESILSNALGKSSKVYARKCNIVALTDDEYKEFTNTNHLQGYVRAKLRYGLKLNDELVCVMSFGKSGHSKSHDYELLRYCNKLGTSVVGGASRLLKHFTKEVDFKNLISYSDMRISNGDMYKRLGFVYLRNTEPNYFYTKDFVKILSREKCQKHKLSELLDNFDETKSEYQNMIANKYYRIFDCGDSVWELKKECP